MLNVFIGNKDDNIEFVEDVNAEFSKLGLLGSALECQFLWSIDRGKFIKGEPFFYINRFGNKLGVDTISTSCKAAICVSRSSSRLINLSECSFNAVGMILSWCRNGNIYLPEFNISFPDYTEGKEIAIQYNDCVFSFLSRFNHYLESEYPFEPDTSIEGVFYAINIYE